MPTTRMSQYVVISTQTTQFTVSIIRHVIDLPTQSHQLTGCTNSCTNLQFTLTRHIQLHIESLHSIDYRFNC